MSVEQSRLNESYSGEVTPWKKWGPYVSERSWGTVREDYSYNGDAWSYFPFEKAASKVYRWGDDAIAGWCDRYQILLFAPVFWNGCDPILKERLFGVNSLEGNHGEDVKEWYFHLDGTPTHSYMKYLYKYPHREFPYQQLVEENRRRKAEDPEYELIDTGIFQDNAYFDIFIEYAKATPEDTCIKIEVFNRGEQSAPLHILPHLWFRNSWGWGDEPLPEPIIVKENCEDGVCLLADDSAMSRTSSLMFEYHLGKRFLYGSPGGTALFTDNEDNRPNKHYHKDGFHQYLIRQKDEAVNPEGKGTKSTIHYFFPAIEPGKSVVLYFRLADKKLEAPLADIDKIISDRKEEADAFYQAVHPEKASDEERLIQRQALAGILWSKQIYLFDVNLWLKGDNTYFKPPDSRFEIRNKHWRHLNSMRILLMPDKWEYPWFASWDLAFHCLTIGLIDIEFAKEQLWLLLFDQFQHPNGQIPAYEWDFSNLNPPLQAFAALKLYEIEKNKFGREDRSFLKKCLTKLLMNFAWWVNRVDSEGNNVFEGGFLGLDNIAIVNRSERLSDGARLLQSDGTGWMGMYCLNLMRMALEIAKEDSSYESIATKFFQHFVMIAYAMIVRDNQKSELWNENDGFFYDVLAFPDNTYQQFPVRSLVGIVPLFAVEILTQEEIDSFPSFKRDFEWFLYYRKEYADTCIEVVEENGSTKYVCSITTAKRLSKILKFVWNPNEFRSDYGLRSLSKFHEDNPVVFKNWEIRYESRESLAKIMGGNSNWRGPVWAPMNYLLIQSLLKYFEGYKEFLIEVEGEDPLNLKEMALSFSARLTSLFSQNQEGKRPYWGDGFPFGQDPNWRDYIIFNEYFDGNTGKGLGASHQTGWTALVANLIDESHPRE